MSPEQLNRIIDAIAEDLDQALFELNDWPQADWIEVEAFEAWLAETERARQ